MAIVLNIPADLGQNGFAEGDTYDSIENIVGSPYGDGITAATGDNVLTGGGGDDLIIGNGGNDTFIFAPGDGDDTYRHFVLGGQYVIDLTAFNLDGFGDLTITDSDNGEDAVVAIAGHADTITLEDRDHSLVTAASFLFETVDNTLVVNGADATPAPVVSGNSITATVGGVETRLTLPDNSGVAAVTFSTPTSAPGNVNFGVGAKFGNRPSGGGDSGAEISRAHFSHV